MTKISRTNKRSMKKSTPMPEAVVKPKTTVRASVMEPKPKRSKESKR